jgi:hypothetical protein
LCQRRNEQTAAAGVKKEAAHLSGLNHHDTTLTRRAGRSHQDWRWRKCPCQPLNFERQNEQRTVVNGIVANSCCGSQLAVADRIVSMWKF